MTHLNVNLDLHTLSLLFRLHRDKPRQQRVSGVDETRDAKAGVLQKSSKLGQCPRTSATHGQQIEIEIGICDRIAAVACRHGFRDQQHSRVGQRCSNRPKDSDSPRIIVVEQDPDQRNDVGICR